MGKSGKKLKKKSRREIVCGHYVCDLPRLLREKNWQKGTAAEWRLTELGTKVKALVLSQ